MGLTEDQIDSIERAIDCQLPPDVRAAYSISDGLIGPLDCYLLYPFEEDRGHQICEMNKLKLEHWFPESFKGLVILGDDGVGNLVCFDTVAGDAVIWNPEDGESIQERRNTVSEIWDVIRGWYKETLESAD